MSATEVIEEIKRLPREGQSVVKQFVERMDATADTAVKYLSDDEVDLASEKIFDRHSNLFKKLAQ
jgi:hypothetical protein